MIPLAVIGSAIIGVIFILFAGRKLQDTPYILIVNCKDEKAEKSALEIVSGSVRKNIIKSKTVNGNGIEMTFEIRVKDAVTDFVNKVNEVEGVSGVTLVTFNGEYMS